MIVSPNTRSWQDSCLLSAFFNQMNGQDSSFLPGNSLSIRYRQPVRYWQKKAPNQYPSDCNATNRQNTIALLATVSSVFA
jgi:hypothetical protein